MTGVAVCLVALYGLQSDAVGTTTTYEFKAVDVDEDAYLAANLARNGKLPVRISEVAKDASLVSTLKEKVESQIVGIQDNPATIDSCDALIKASNLADIFHHSFDYEQSPNYLKLLQAALDAGVQVFKTKGYQNKWEEIWEVDAGASLAHFLGANSTKIGCVIGECIKVQTDNPDKRSSTKSSTGKAALFCELNPAAEKKKAPFDEEYCNGLVARTAQLTDITEQDLKAPSSDGTATAAVSTILAACLTAMLTAVSA